MRLAAYRGLAIVAAPLISLTWLGSGDSPSRQNQSSFADKLAPGVRAAAHSAGTQSVIVQLSEPVAPQVFTELTRAGATVMRRYQHLPMASLRVRGTALPRLASLPFVRRISPELAVRRSLDRATAAVGAAEAVAEAGLTGKGVTVAVIDSGIDHQRDLGLSATDASSRIIGGRDFLTAAGRMADNDLCGHGTAVAGIVAGNGYESSYSLNPVTYCTRRFRGVAPEANLVNLRILDQNGAGTVSDAIAALDWCIANRAALNLRVVNMSLGHPPTESYTTDPLCQAAERAWQAGILVVCAAGNRGRSVVTDPNSAPAYGTIDSPGIDPFVLTVGATNCYTTQSIQDDAVTSYSSRGPSRPDHILKPDLVAPGNRIIAIRHPQSKLEREIGPNNLVALSEYWSAPPQRGAFRPAYYQLSGTSMAAAVVSGAAALMFQADPTLTPNDVKARMMKTARKLWRADGRCYDIYSRGAGLLNVAAALQCTARVSGFALSPRVALVNGAVVLQPFAPSAMVGGQQALWGDDPASFNGNGHGPWTEQALWGDEGHWNEQAIGANQALWGDDPASVRDEPGNIGGDEPPSRNRPSQALWGDVSRIAVEGE